MDDPVVPLDHAYVYGPVPPVAEAEAEPSLAMPQLASVAEGDPAFQVKVPALIVTDPTAVHPLASVTVTVYVPADSPVSVEAVPPEDQRYVYPGVPPEAATEADPSVAPPQLAEIELVDAATVEPG